MKTQLRQNPCITLNNRAYTEKFNWNITVSCKNISCQKMSSQLPENMWFQPFSLISYSAYNETYRTTIYHSFSSVLLLRETKWILVQIPGTHNPSVPIYFGQYCIYYIGQNISVIMVSYVPIIGEGYNTTLITDIYA